MNRGRGVHELHAVCQAVSRLEDIGCNGVYSHLASAIHKDRDLTLKQLELFAQQCGIVRGYFPETIRHLSNTSAALSFTDAHPDMARVGLGMYGYCDKAGITLKPAKSVHCLLLKLRLLTKAKALVTTEHSPPKSERTEVVVINGGYGS